MLTWLTTVRRKLLALVALSAGVMVVALPVLGWQGRKQLLTEAAERVRASEKGFETELLELGREVERHGRIRAKRVQQLKKVLRHQIKIARKAGAQEVLIAATRAMRAAKNGPAVVKELERALEVPVRD